MLGTSRCRGVCIGIARLVRRRRDAEEGAAAGRVDAAAPVGRAEGGKEARGWVLPECPVGRKEVGKRVRAETT